MKTKRHIGIIRCKECKELAISEAGGLFGYCPCKKSFVDQERFSGLYVRTGGSAKFIEQICPSTCEHKEEHIHNKKIEDFDELKKYIKETYKHKISLS